MSDKTLRALSAAVLRILRPLVRILLRNGVSYGTFADFAKWVYVDVASREFAIEGRKQSVSRVSVITGLTRKEVTRVQQLPKPDDDVEAENYNRAARVISGWLRDPYFTDDQGQPRIIPLDGESPSFSELVRRHSGDMPARAILDELLRVEAVQRDEEGKIHLRANAYIPKGGEADKLHILGTDAAALIETIDHNLRHETQQTFYQRKVAYDNLPDEALPAFRDLSAQQAQALLEKLNEWLAERDRDTNPDAPGSGRNTAGLGIYYFEAPNGDEEDVS